MKLERFILACALSLFGTSVGGSQPAPVPVVNPDIPLHFNGFDVKPPAGENWYVFIRNDESVFFSRRIVDSNVHTFAAFVVSTSLPASLVSGSTGDYFALLKKMQQTLVNPSYQRLLEEDYATENTPGRLCLHYRLKSETVATPRAPAVPLILETIGISCAHPDSLRRMVDIHYTERGGPGLDTARMRQQGEVFIHGIVFTPLK